MPDVSSAALQLLGNYLCPARLRALYRSNQHKLESAASMRQTVALVLASMFLSALAACNTVQGVGRDIESVGTAGKEVIH